MALLQGLCAFPITPVDDDGIVDAPSMEKLIARVCTGGVDSVCVLGSTGLYPYLDRRERRRVIQCAVQAAETVPVMAGIGALRTADVLALGRDAQEAGAAGVLLAPVSYIPLTDDEVYALFQTVSAALDIPLCIYNNPGTTHFTFSTGLIARLSRLPGIAGVKNPAPGAQDVHVCLDELRSAVAPDFSIGYSRDWNTTEALIAGADTWYSVAAGLFPTVCAALVRAAKSGDISQARALDSRLRPLWDIFEELSSLRVMYAAAAQLGLCRYAPPRPILALRERDRQRVAAALDAADLR